MSSKVNPSISVTFWFNNRCAIGYGVLFNCTIDKSNHIFLLMTTQKMCLGKSMFWSLVSAQTKANNILKKGGKYMRAYRCPNCRQFHLTSHGKKGKPMKENKDLVTKWETTGLLQKASDKNKLAGLLEQSINIVLNCLKGQEGEDAERKLLFPAIVRIAFDEKYNFEVQALWKDYQTWLQKTSGFEPTNVTVKRFLTSVERKYL